MLFVKKKKVLCSRERVRDGLIFRQNASPSHEPFALTTCLIVREYHRMLLKKKKKKKERKSQRDRKTEKRI